MAYNTMMHVQFWSSTEYSGFLADLIQEICKREGDGAARQRFLISESSYRSAASGWGRVILRLKQYLVYPLYLCGSLLFGEGRRADVIVVTTNTFYAPLLATLFHKRVIHLVYDLFPEAFQGDCSSATEHFCRWVVHHSLLRAHANVFLGQQLRTYVESVY